MHCSGELENALSRKRLQADAGRPCSLEVSENLQKDEFLEDLGKSDAAREWLVFVFTRTVLQKLQHLWLAWHVVFLDMCFPFGMRTSFLELSVAVDLKRRPRVLEQLSCSFLPSLLSLEALQAALLSERAALFLHRSKIGGFLSRTLV